MGRGRAKAKQTKVARDLKYRTHETDFGALAQELHAGSSRTLGTSHDDLQDDDVDDTGDLDDLDDLDAPGDEADGWSDPGAARRR